MIKDITQKIPLMYLKDFLFFNSLKDNLPVHLEIFWKRFGLLESTFAFIVSDLNQGAFF